ncbi:beta family protein [Vibrio fluvialis]|uniref:beta family protein n=1 Tax=Vibrio fluvialis TaxID=676 RepID=UPI0003FC589B|nr:hypothetical protein [Vibrio fluvialis]MCG6391418.1 beta family protein [Vibrio fluvialis]MCG6418941.1 beta family protein [Vibrio fluvialis]
MSDFKYFPTIKTRDAELKCFSKLEPNVLRQVLPIYELTKSRKTNKTPDGDIHRRMKQIKEIQGELPFILDLCTSEKYINPQIEQLIDEYEGFYDWRYFLNLYSDMNIIPMVHLYEDEQMTFAEVTKFVIEMSGVKTHLAVRIPYNLDEDDIRNYLAPIANNLQNGCTLFVLLDADHIRNKDTQELADSFEIAFNEVMCFGDRIEDVVMLCSSFPRSPADYGEDHLGEFTILEEQLFQNLKQRVPIKYGDYASINTEQIEMKGGTFVPRIDVSLADKFIYKRYRRNEGSYPKCAQQMELDTRYIKIGCWADDEITLANNNKPSGISPSFWIAVRMNYYVTSRVTLRAQD